MLFCSKIKHDNLLPVNGACFEPGHIGLVSAYMPNSNLRQILSNNDIPISMPTRLSIARQIADAMDYLSKQPVPEISIHSNLKSNNVLFNVEQGKVKVTDHGQGNLKDLARTMTSVGTVAWTGNY